MTLHAMAVAILEYRRALRMLSKAIGWADVAHSSRSGKKRRDLRG